MRMTTAMSEKLFDQINWRSAVDWVNALWAKSLVAVVLFLLGLLIGSVNTESRIASDCKFAGAFRVEIQAFNCQRKL
jgi:hypothetical protein